MIEPALLWLYFLTVFAVIALPGMDMAFVLGSSLGGGVRAGLWAVAGLLVGGLCHMLIGATGLSMVFNLAPSALGLMLLLGAGYVGWLGYQLIRIDATQALAVQARARGHWRSFAGAIATCLLNPKAYMFMLAVVPQFVRSDRGSIWVQVGTLALITAATQALIYGVVAVTASRLRQQLGQRPALNLWFARSTGALLIATALLTTWSGFGAGPSLR